MRNRKSTIRIALLISVAIHGAVLLWVRFDPFDTAPPIAIPTIEVTLIATPPVDQPDPEPAVPVPEPEPEPEPENPQSPQVLLTPPEPGPASSPTVPASAESTDPIDWDDIISTFAEEATMQNLEQEDQREAMWRKTFSVMFKPPEDWLIEDEPYLPDLQFEADKPKRLGIKISENCYLGLPGIDPQTVDSDGPAWNSSGTPPPTVDLINCGFGG